MQEVYNVDLVIIPSLNKKQYIELPTIVAVSETDWRNEICISAINEAKKERGTLIICETIDHAKILEEQLKIRYRKGVLKIYTMNNMNQQRDIE